MSAAGGETAMLPDMEKAWQEVQKKAYMHWVNTFMDARGYPRVTALEDSFSDGVTIARFVEALCDRPPRISLNIPKKRIQIIENTHLALEILRAQGVESRYLTVSAEDFVDRNIKLLLGFLWMLLHRFRVAKHLGATGGDDDATLALLEWIRSIVADYPGTNVMDFKTGFSDGNALLALAHVNDRVRFDFNERVNNFSSHDNIKFAFERLEADHGIPCLLDPMSVADGSVDERGLKLYMMLLYHAFSSAQGKAVTERERVETMDRIRTLEEQLEAAKKAIEERDQRVATLEAQRAAVEQSEAAFRAAAEDQAGHELAALDVLRNNLLQHLDAMHDWKHLLEQDRAYGSETIQIRTQREVADLNVEDQVSTLADLLGEENKRLMSLLKHIRREERRATGGVSSPVSGADGRNPNASEADSPPGGRETSKEPSTPQKERHRRAHSHKKSRKGATAAATPTGSSSGEEVAAVKGTTCDTPEASKNA